MHSPRALSTLALAQYLALRQDPQRALDMHGELMGAVLSQRSERPEQALGAPHALKHRGVPHPADELADLVGDALQVFQVREVDDQAPVTARRAYALDSHAGVE